MAPDGVTAEDGMAIPEPGADDEFSGKFMVRVPRGIHKALSEAAKREGVSLNSVLKQAGLK